MVATSRGRLDMAELSLQMGADCQAYLSNGWTAKECPRQQGQEVNIHNQQVEGAVEGAVLVFLPGYEDFSIV